MSSQVIRVEQHAGGLFMATTHLDRVATSPELAVRLAGAAALGCEMNEVHVTGQARNLYLVTRINRGATPLDKGHGSEVPS